jgi:hypothetical protein
MSGSAAMGRRRLPRLRLLGRVLDRTAFGGLLLLLVWAPWPLGSNRPWAVSLLALGAWLGVALALAGYVGGRPWPLGISRARWPLAMVAGFCAIAAAQVAWGSPQGTVFRVLSPWHASDYLLRALACAGAMLLTVLTVRSRERCTTVLGVVLLAGLLQAFAAVLLASGDTAYVYLYERFDPSVRVSGTFVNPNHFAAYLALTLAAGTGLLLAQMKGSGDAPEDWRTRLVAALSFVLSAKMLLRLALVVMVVALVSTHSRMGNVAFFVALLGAGGLVALLSRQLRRPALWLVATMVLIDLLVIGRWIGFDRIAERLQATSVRAPEVVQAPPAAASGASTAQGSAAAPRVLMGRPPPREESLEERLEVPGLALPLVLQRPWFGHGGGSFHLAFAPIKPESVFGGTWTHAHNDYVEVATDLGVPALLLLLGIGIFSTHKALRLLPDGQPRLNRGVGVAALLGIIATGLHSWVDFGLQIPAIGLTFSVMLALSWLAAGLPLADRRSHGAARAARTQNRSKGRS